MTRPFTVQYDCQNCGRQSSAETAFGRWMRNHPALHSEKGIIRTDTDHTILQYKTHPHGRDFQLIMDIEVKTFGAYPDLSQRDILSFKHQLARKTGRNINGSRTTHTHILKSTMTGRRVRVRYCGTHLLQFEKTNPNDSTWIRWDHKPITTDVLVDLLRFVRNPEHPEKLMEEFLRDRHRQQRELPLLEKMKVWV